MKILIINQAFPPDTVSSGQHAADLAEGLARAGHQVTVLTSSRAYDNPEVRFPSRETWRNVEILRIGASGFGKGTRWRRALDFSTFTLNCFLTLLRLRAFDITIAMTSPPLIGVAAAAAAKLKGGTLVSWILDLNPDEAIAAGWLSETSFTGQVLEGLLRLSLRISRRVFVMDRFMAARVASRGVPSQKLTIAPPWSHTEAVTFDPDGRTEFRRRHGLEGKFVVMYSGNHSPCHPLTSLLIAALQLRSRADVVFLFVGGGSEFARVSEFAAAHQLTNIRQLPYQPLTELSSSLSAADLHAVVMGEAFVGIVHTCKVYNILALGIPFIYIGPEQSHILDLAAISTAAVWMHHALPGDAARVVRVIENVKSAGPYPRPWEQAASRNFTQSAILPRMIREIEAVGDPSAPAIQPLNLSSFTDAQLVADPAVIDEMLRQLHERDC